MKSSVKFVTPAPPKAEEITITFTATEYERLMRCLYHSAVATDRLYIQMTDLADDAGIRRGSKADDHMLAGTHRVR